MSHLKIVGPGDEPPAPPAESGIVKALAAISAEAATNGAVRAILIYQTEDAIALRGATHDCMFWARGILATALEDIERELQDDA